MLGSKAREAIGLPRGPWRSSWECAGRSWGGESAPIWLAASCSSLAVLSPAFRTSPSTTSFFSGSTVLRGCPWPPTSNCLLTLASSDQQLFLFCLVGYSPQGHKESDMTEQLNSSKSSPECWKHCPSLLTDFLCIPGMELTTLTGCLPPPPPPQFLSHFYRDRNTFLHMG